MGLFRKRRADEAAASSPAAPAIVGDDDLDRAGWLLRQFGQAIGSDSAIRAVVLAIAEAGAQWPCIK